MKIALCLFGIVGSATDKYGIGSAIDYRIGHHFIKKHILDKNDVDIFIHSWSTDFKGELVDTYKPKKYLIEEQIDFEEETIRQHSIKSRWYSNKKVIELKAEYEKENNFKYDFVMVYRFDCMFIKDLIFSEFDNKYFYTSHKVECYNNSCQCEYNGNYADLWFFGNSHDIDLFGELYNHCDGGYGMDSPHTACKNHIVSTGIHSRVKHAFIDRYDHFPVRAKFKNCEYINEEFDLSRLREFDNINVGYIERSGKTSNFIIDRS
jgi:hypothetical protein|tara:strand:- start:473 stop:1261 length:789 start_codon:yes stop_codon:yes gene_type:complete